MGKEPRKKSIGKSPKVPLNIFRNRQLAPLEAISEYLKDVQGLTYHQIAEMLNRDDRTIWTCYSRAKKKHAKSAEAEK